MAFPNSTYTDIVTTTLARRSPKIADAVTKNNGLLFRLKEKGRVRPAPGGRTLVEPVAFAENGNAQAYSGGEQIAVQGADVISAAEFNWKQYACAVTINGLEGEIQNSGEDAVFNLLDERIGVAESTMMNLICDGCYSDGTGYGSKEIGGLDLLVPVDPTTGTVGGIDRSNAANAFMRSVVNTVTISESNVIDEMNETWAQIVRGNEHPDLIMAGRTFWTFFVSALQTNQRFSDPKLAESGFTTLKYMNADVILDGGIGGFATATDAYFLNSKYLSFRPHTKRNMVPLEKRAPVNQDMEVEILAWAGNMTLSFGKPHARIVGA